MNESVTKIRTTLSQISTESLQKFLRRDKNGQFDGFSSKKHKFELGQVQSNPYHRVFKPIEEQDDSGLVGDDHEQVELFGFHTKNFDICQRVEVKGINKY